MPRTATRWRDLAPGAVVLLVLVLGALAILRFARVGALRGDTFHVALLTGTAYDVEPGTEVWLVGQKVGAVTAVDFRPASTDTARRILVSLEILERARPLLRKDTRVDFRAGGSLLGARVVALSPGTPDAPPLGAGDTLVSVQRRDLASLTDAFADVRDDVPVLRGDVNAILRHFREGDGTLGAATRAEGFAALGGLQQALVSLTTQLSGTDDGSLGRLVRSPDLRARVLSASARADSVRQLMDAPTGTLGRFRRDSTLLAQVAAVRDEVAIVRALVDLPAGTAGRVVHDGVIAARLRELERELDLLMADVKERPLRYLTF